MKILQSKLKCDNYPALKDKGTHREINDPRPRKEVQLHSNLSTVNLLPYVLSDRGFLFAPVCLSEVQLVSWPSQAVKASSFHWNRWRAQGRKPLRRFYPKCIKTSAEGITAAPFSVRLQRPNTLQKSHDTSAFCWIGGRLLWECFGKENITQPEWIQKSVPRSMTEMTVGIKYRKKGLLNFLLETQRKKLLPGPLDRQRTPVSRAVCLTHEHAQGEGRKRIKTPYKVIKCSCEMIKADCSCSVLLCDSSPDN